MKRTFAYLIIGAMVLGVLVGWGVNQYLGADQAAAAAKNLSLITDVFLLCTAANDRQVRAVVDAIEERLAGEGEKPIRREGEKESRWVLLDYGDIVIHVQIAEERIHYALERLWKDCPSIPLDVDTSR